MHLRGLGLVAESFGCITSYAEVIPVSAIAPLLPVCRPLVQNTNQSLLDERIGLFATVTLELATYLIVVVNLRSYRIGCGDAISHFSAAC